MPELLRVPTQNALQYTLDSALDAGETSNLTLNQSVAGIVQAPGICVIDRIDSSGNTTPSKREYIKFDTVSGAQLQTLTRGRSGSSDQAHAVGAIVEFVPDVEWAEALYDTIKVEHDDGGIHVSLPSLNMLGADNILASAASIEDLTAKRSIIASGASLMGVNPFRPVWNIRGLQSAATTGVGTALQAIQPGTLEFVNVTLGRGQAPSLASVLVDINKNGTSIFHAGTRPFLLGGESLMSSASINTKSFVAGDVFDLDVDNVGNLLDINVVLHGR